MTRKFVWLITSIFFLLGIFLLLQHELWRDELQPWLLAGHSNSIKELYLNTRYEGHQMLWFIVVYFARLINNDPTFIQWPHLIIATASVFLFLKYSPFKPLHKILFAFSYFAAYEYCIISRNYGIGVLLLFAACLLIQSKKKNAFVTISALLFFIMQTNAYALFLAIPFFLFLLYDVTKSKYPLLQSPTKPAIGIGIIIFLTGVFLSVATAFPPQDTGFIPEWRFVLQFNKIEKAFSIIWTSYVPIPHLRIHFWNTYILDDHSLSDLVQFILSLSILFFCSILFLRNQKVLFLYLTGTFIILAFTYVKFHGYQRHHGYLFILFIICLWLNELNTLPNGPHRKWRLRFLNYIPKFKNSFITMILSSQVIAFVIAAYYEIKYPFSQHEAAANYITQNHLENIPTIGDDDAPSSAVGALLNKEFFYPRSNRWGSYLIWDNKRKKEPTDSMIVKSANEISKKNNSDALLVLSHPLRLPVSGIELLTNTGNSIVQDEVYYIYRLKLNNDHSIK